MNLQNALGKSLAFTPTYVTHFQKFARELGEYTHGGYQDQPSSDSHSPPGKQGRLNNVGGRSSKGHQALSDRELARVLEAASKA